jgi:hypothetical protein
MSATFGIAGGAMLTDKIFLIGNLVNAYTDPTDPFGTVGDFSSIELGWTRGQERIYQDNAHLTLWHVDESAPAGMPGGCKGECILRLYFHRISYPYVQNSNIPHVTFLQWSQSGC